MTFSYNGVWNEAVQSIRRHSSLLIALAGVFIFLPSLLIAYFIPQPQATTIAELILLLEEHFRANWHWLLLGEVVNMVGALAILNLQLGRGGPTVASVIVAAFALVPFYFLASILSAIIFGLGFALLILPGLYLFGRMSTLGPVMVMEDRRNPIDALQRTFETTRGYGWAVTGLILLVAVAATIIAFIFTAILGSLFILVGGQQIGQLLALIVRAAFGAAVSTLMTILFGVIYLRLTGSESGGD